jgi:hypothetical protein
MLNSIFNIYKDILNKKEKNKTKIFIILNVIYAIFELVSIAAVLPIIFLAIGPNLNNLNFNLP